MLRLNGVGRKEARDRSYAVLETVGLDASLATKYPGQLSGGQQQRVGVARGLVTDPNILLMDEPFGAVDPIVREELQAELLRLQRELDKTIVFVTHDIDEAFLLGDQVVILKKGGKIAQVGSPADILASPADDFVRSFVGLDKGKRTLRIEKRDDGTSVVVDGTGKAAGSPRRHEVILFDEHRPGHRPAAAPPVAQRRPDRARVRHRAADRLVREPAPAARGRPAEPRQRALHDPVARAVRAAARRSSAPRSSTRPTSSSP